MFRKPPDWSPTNKFTKLFLYYEISSKFTPWLKYPRASWYVGFIDEHDEETCDKKDPLDNCMNKNCMTTWDIFSFTKNKWCSPDKNGGDDVNAMNFNFWPKGHFIK